MADNKRFSNRQLLEFFRSRLSGSKSEGAMRYRKTLSELESFLLGHRLRLSALSETMMADWATDLLSRGLAASTVSRHLNSLNGMMKDAAKEGMIPQNNSARTVSKALSDMKDLPPLLSAPIFESTLSTLRNALRERDDNNYDPFLELLLFSMLNGAADIDSIARMKKADMAGYEGESLSIMTRNADARRDYVFNLHQSELTPRQLKAAISSGILASFDSRLGGPGFDSDVFVRSLWAACAVKSGLAASEALGYVDGEASYSIPAFCSPAPAPDHSKTKWVDAVNTMLTSEMPKWHVMQMRRGVSFDELQKEIFDRIHPRPVLYYPCETIMRVRGGRKRMEERPVIDRIVFFKCYPDKVLQMFSAIGDMAWCYRLSGAPGSPYAVIPQRDMERFQRAVGVFTPETEIHPLHELTPKPGESVILIKAGFGDRPATVENVVKTDCGSVIFRVKLNTDCGYEFRIDVDARQIERIIGR